MSNEKIGKKALYEIVRGFENTRVLHYKYLAATKRIKITDKWFKKSITIPYNYAFSSQHQKAYSTVARWQAADNALAYLIKNNWNVSAINRDSQIIIIDGWDSNKQLK